MLSGIRVALGIDPPHCRTCGLQKLPRERQAGYRSDGSPIVQRRRVCPRQDSLYGFDGYGGVHDPTDCHGLAPWACPHEIAAWKAHRPAWGACPHRICPDRPSMDE